MNISGLSLQVLGLLSRGSGESHLLKDWGGELYFPHPYPVQGTASQVTSCVALFNSPSSSVEVLLPILWMRNRTFRSCISWG